MIRKSSVIWAFSLNPYYYIVLQWLAIGVLFEPASKSVFSASFGLSSSKGDSLTSFSAPKSSQKYLIFRSQNFKITKNFFEQDKNAGYPVGLSSILVKFTGIFVS